MRDVERRQAMETVAKLLHYRDQTKLEEEQTASELGFLSPDVMYLQLKNWGLPPWLVYGNSEAGKPRSGSEPKSVDGKRVRKPRKTGESTKLPRAGEAEDLFREALRSLCRYVDLPDPPKGQPTGFMDTIFSTESPLDSLEEHLQAERFISFELNRPNPEFIQKVRREDFSGEEWKQVCEEYGENPDQDHFWIDAEFGFYVHGATRAPADVLVKLIGTYVLADKPLEPLLEKLHPEPETVDKEQLERIIYGKMDGDRHIDGLWDKVRQVARIVRGGTIRRGPSTESLSTEDVLTAWNISRLKEKGFTYQQIHEHGRFVRRGYSLKDIERLGAIDPTQPELELYPKISGGEESE